MKNTLVGMNDGLDTTEERIDWLIKKGLVNELMDLKALAIETIQNVNIENRIPKL